MKVLFFDCISGISGDMALGALIDAGADADAVRQGLETLPIEPFEIEIGEVETHGIHATKVTVKPAATSLVRTYANIRQLLDEAKLPPRAQALAQRIFRRLAEAEATVHRRDVEQVAFHEVGAVDSIVDITGVALALTQLEIDRIFSSAVPTGLGLVKSEHGMMPIPAPAVVELLRGVPMFSRGIPMEMVTPTGAAILSATVEGFGELPQLRLTANGYGAGTIRPDFPNVLRVLIGEQDPQGTGDRRSPQVGEMVLETNIDDMNPEFYDYVLERLFDAGAADAWLTPIVMKKGRPAIKVSVLAPSARVDAIRQVLFTETGTLGVRSSHVEKQALQREWLAVETSNGRVSVKLGILDGRVVTAAPEYEDCVRVAREAGVPARDIYEEATALARRVLADRR